MIMGVWHCYCIIPHPSSISKGHNSMHFLDFSTDFRYLDWNQIEEVTKSDLNGYPSIKLL